LLGATAIVGAVAAVIAIVGLKRIQTLNQKLTQTVNFLATNAKLAALIKQNLISAARAERNMLLARSESGRSGFIAVIDDTLALQDRRLKELRPVVDDDDRQRLARFEKKWAEWRENHRQVRRLAAVNSDAEASNISLGEAEDAIDRLDKALGVIVEQAESDLAAAKQAKSDLDIATAAEVLNAAAAVSRASLTLHRAEKNLLLASSTPEVHRYEETIEPLARDLETRVEKLGVLARGNNADAMIEVNQAVGDYIDANRRIQALAGEESKILVYHYVNDIGIPIAAECEAVVNELIARNEERMQAYRISGQQEYTDSRNELLGISILGILASVSISFYTGQRIARRLRLLTLHAETIQATGDLSRPTPDLGKDEVGLLAQALDHMRESLHDQKMSLSEHTERLAKLTKSLESKNSEMEQFVYTVSHDLKSPLVSCKGLLGLLREDVADGNHDAVLDSVARLDQATDQLNHTIDDLLMLSRIGRKKLAIAQIDVHKLVESLLDELADRVAEANAEIEIQEDLPRVFADEFDTRRVFENLLTNAIKYGDKDSNPKIVVGGTSTDREVRYFVRDNGPGIDPKHHNRIFGLFQRLNTDSPGTGLGLASVAKIMSMHGGRSWVESDLGKGATFWIAFPQSPRPVDT
jgi:signal transduction histidine kinase